MTDLQERLKAHAELLESLAESKVQAHINPEICKQIAEDIREAINETDRPKDKAMSWMDDITAADLTGLEKNACVVAARRRGKSIVMCRWAEAAEKAGMKVVWVHPEDKQ